jgi:hypothetical protein
VEGKKRQEREEREEREESGEKDKGTIAEECG